MTPGFTVSILVFGLLVIVMFLFARFWQNEYKQVVKEKRELRYKYNRCLDELNDEQYNRMRLNGMYQELIRENDRMRQQLHNLNFNKRNTTPTVEKDLIDAVRRGMMAAHPDHGGKQEDFIRFNKVYKELKGRAH